MTKRRPHLFPSDPPFLAGLEGVHGALLKVKGHPFAFDPRHRVCCKGFGHVFAYFGRATAREKTWGWAEFAFPSTSPVRPPSTISLICIAFGSRKV